MVILYVWCIFDQFWELVIWLTMIVVVCSCQWISLDIPVMHCHSETDFTVRENIIDAGMLFTTGSLLVVIWVNHHNMLSIRIVSDIMCYYSGLAHRDWNFNNCVSSNEKSTCFFGGTVPWSVVTRVCYFLMKARWKYRWINPNMVTTNLIFFFCLNKEDVLCFLVFWQYDCCMGSIDNNMRVVSH